ncbi:MAG TPA: MFS transporter [Steroidobacteraceae bacterium]|nr:MFS transporter [Steroidobacteraceae bacterium]
MKKLHYAWIVLGVTFVSLLVSAAIRATPAVLIVPLEHEFGWSRATISFAISVNTLLYGLIGPFAAGFINRYGPRRMMTASAILIGTGTLASVTIQHPWELLAYWGVLVGIGTGIIAVVLGASVVQKWFHANRGLALGLLTASAATGQLVFLPLLARIVVDHGWRSAVMTMALVAFAIAPLVMLLMRDSPEGVGLRPLGLHSDAVLSPSVVVRNPFAAAWSALATAGRTRTFWLLAGSFFVCGASTNGLVGTHLIPACMDHGIPEVEAASLLAVMGIFDLIGTTGSGWLSDRVDSRYLLFAYYGLRGVALLYLPYGFDAGAHGLSWFAVFYGLDWIATVPPTVALTRAAFGAENVGLVFGWIMAAHQVGAALATSFAGLIRTQEGSYDHAFMIAGGLCIATAFSVLWAVSVDRLRKSPLPT